MFRGHCSPLHLWLRAGLCSDDGLVTIARPLLQAEVARLLPGHEPGHPSVPTGPPPLASGTQHLQLLVTSSSPSSRHLTLTWLTWTWSPLRCLLGSWLLKVIPWSPDTCLEGPGIPGEVSCLSRVLILTADTPRDRERVRSCALEGRVV